MTTSYGRSTKCWKSIEGRNIEMDTRQQCNNKLHGEQGIIVSIIGPDGRLRGIIRPAE